MPVVLPPDAEAAIDKLLDNRGAILIAFAQIEWFAAKLIVEAAGFAEYKDLDLSFSQDFAKRAERLKNILAVAGPFSPYADDLIKRLDLVLKHERLRNMAAHGLMIRPDNLNLSSIMHFRMYRMYKGGVLAEEQQDLTIKEYTDQSAELTSAARGFVNLIRRIWQELKLKGLDPVG